MAQHPNNENTGKKIAQPKTEKAGKRQGAVTPDPTQTHKTGPSGLSNLTADPGTTPE